MFFVFPYFRQFDVLPLPTPCLLREFLQFSFGPASHRILAARAGIHHPTIFFL